MAAIFQTYLDKRQSDARLPKLLEYSRVTRPGAETCANLSLVFLGLVDANYYLQSCRTRGGPTPWEEITGYIQSSFVQCGIRVPRPAVSPSADVQTKPNPREYLKSAIEEVSRLLDPQHATVLGMSWTAGGGHAVVLYKTATGELRYIDPTLTMTVGGQQVFPFAAIGIEQILDHLVPTIKELIIIVTSGRISKEDSLSGKCMTTRAPMLMEGGSRRSRLARKNGKKTKKARKHHGVRTYRRRH